MHRHQWKKTDAFLAGERVQHCPHCGTGRVRDVSTKRLYLYRGTVRMPGVQLDLLRWSAFKAGVPPCVERAAVRTKAPRKKLDPVIIRPGDTVIVTVPKFVKRVGYPKCDADYLDQLANDAVAQAEVDVLLHKLTKRSWHAQHGKHRTRERIERDIAHLMALADGYGGKERSIHWREWPAFAEVRADVISLRNVYTGRYYPPHASQSYDEYEPGGLSEKTCWRLAKLEIGCLLSPEGESFEIPIQHLQKVIK